MITALCPDALNRRNTISQIVSITTRSRLVGRLILFFSLRLKSLRIRSLWNCFFVEVARHHTNINQRRRQKQHVDIAMQVNGENVD